MIAGTCEFCGCTESTPCSGGCAWIDEARTRCTMCDLAFRIVGPIGAMIAKLQQPSVADWASRPVEDQRLLIAACRVLLSALLMSDEASHVWMDFEVQELVQALGERYPEVVEGASKSGVSLKDMVLGILGDHAPRIVLAEGALR